MKLNIFSFLIILTFLSSCNGQNNSKVHSKKENTSVIDITKVETTKELGENIMLVYHDKQNNYWFGSSEDGLYKYDGKKILHFTTKNGLPNNGIGEIKEDHLGNIYFNTGGGIIKSDGENFNLLQVNDFESNWQLKHNDLWFKDGWDSGYVYRYDGSYLYKLKLPKTKIGEDHLLNYPNYPNPYTVYSIYKDNKGNVWFGTGGLGAFRYNGESFDWILEKDVVEIFNEPNEGSNGVRSIVEDKNGDFWFNTEYRYSIYDNATLNSNKFYSRHKSIGGLDGKKDRDLDEYLATVRDDNKNLWFVTYLNGVWKYDGSEITHYTVQDNIKDITLFSIYKDNNGDLWLGTHENGVFKFNGQTFERFKPF
ncbi:hypothetical protein EAX61_05815 [Dokdonia sinensis]|uniref:Diguanylate cyclase n=1 Tax=Dokdonia sinensis TaxID=2479847 RepID=A0A3M0G998_9FLAO|nr:two-component regulator propeller domain-containing protein [Dokdonia sinensis]RMB60998.1 hypothetical protein EAX61_05815 [Dokdonia sinensis]